MNTFLPKHQAIKHSKQKGIKILQYDSYT